MKEGDQQVEGSKSLSLEIPPGAFYFSSDPPLKKNGVVSVRSSFIRIFSKFQFFHEFANKLIIIKFFMFFLHDLSIEKEI